MTAAVIPIRIYADAATCTACGGKCCKSAPGAAYPEDFATPDDLRAALKGGRYAIDWWDGDPRPDRDDTDRAYFVRPAIQGYEGDVLHPSWGGPCTFLGPTGCTLSEAGRPHECRMLEPRRKPGEHCIAHAGGKRGAAIAWLGHPVVAEFTGEDWQLDE